MSDGLVFGALLGGLAVWGYTHWNEPTAISNAKEQIEGAVVLEAWMSGQVALIHGFVDDFEVCWLLKERLEINGGSYSCKSQKFVSKIP